MCGLCVCGLCVCGLCVCVCVCRFVEYATTRDVLSAIQEFHNYEVGRGKKLVVRVKEDKGKRDERMAWLNKERDFLHSLNATGDLEEVGVDKDVPDNPLEPRYIPHHPTSPEKPTPPAGESRGPSDTLLGSSAGAASLKASPPPSAAGEEMMSASETSPKEHSKGEKSKLPCHICQTPTVKKCCDVPYCSSECQRKDWPTHKIRCSRSKSAAPQVPKQSDRSPSVPKAKQRSITVPSGPLEGFHVSVGGHDDDDDDDDDGNLAADASISLTPSKEKPNKLSLDSEVGSASSESLGPYPSLLNSPLSVSLPSQVQLCDDGDSSGDDGNDDMLDCQPKTPPGSPPVPGQSSNTPAVEAPPPSHDPPKEDVAPTFASNRQSENSSRKSGVNYLSTRELLAVFEQCPAPLSSHPISEFPPEEFVGIVTSAFSPTQFHVVLATSHVKEALLKLLDYGSTVTPAYCGPASLNEGLIYGYIDDYGDFYRVELVYRSGAVLLHDMGLRLTVQTSRLFQLSEEIKSIPQLCFQMTLHNLHYEPDKKENGREFLFNLMKGRPFIITNHSIRAYKSSTVDINFIICSVTSLDHSIDVADLVLKNNFGKLKKEDGSGKSRSQSKDSSVFHKKLDLSPSKADSSPGKVFPTRSSTKALGEKKDGDSSGGDGTVTPASQQKNGGFCSPPKKSPLLSSPLEARKPMFIDGSPDKIGKLQNNTTTNQNGIQSQEARPQTPPTQKIQSPDGKSSIKYKLVQMSNKVAFHNPPVGVMFEIRPIVVLNPNIIWAQVIHNNVNNFKLMEMDLNKVYESRKNEPYAPAPGEMCAAKYPQDQKYYRVEVLCVNHSGTVDIQLVDHGFRDTVTMRQIHHLDPIFLSLPKQALQFSLVGIVPAGMANTWSDNSIAFIKEKILNRVVPVKIVMQTPATCMAEVWDPDEPMQLLNSSLVELGLAQESPMFGHFGVGRGVVGSDTASVALKGVSVTARQGQPPKAQSTAASQDQEQLPSLVTSKPDVPSHPPHDSEQPHGRLAGEPTPPNPMLQFRLPILLKPVDFEKPKSSAATFNPLLSPPSSLPSSGAHVETSPAVSLSLSKFSKSESESQKSPAARVKSPVCNFSPSNQGGGRSSKQPSVVAASFSSPSTNVMSAKSGESVPPPKQPSNSISSPPSSSGAATMKASGWNPKQPSTLTSSNASMSSTSITSTAKASGGGWSPKQSGTSHTATHSIKSTPAKTGGWSPKQSDSNSSASVMKNDDLTCSSTATRGHGWSPKPPNAQQQQSTSLQHESKSSAGRRERSPQAQTGGRLKNNQKLTIDSVKLEPSDKPVEAIMLHVENPLRFYVQLVKDESYDSYMKMANELNQVNLVPYTNPSSGDFCLCRFPDDGTVARVKILKVEDDSVHVMHIDYGIRKKVTLDALFKMGQRFSQIPAQAIQCTLNQLLNPSGKNNPWTQEAVDFFLDKVRTGKDSPDVLLVTCVQVVRGTVHVVNVTISGQKGGKDLLGLMIEAKLGGSVTMKFDKSSNQRSKREEGPKGRRPNQSPFSKSSSSSSLIGSPLKQNVSSSEGGLSSWTKASSDESTAATVAQSDSPFKKQASVKKSPFSEERSKTSPSRDSLHKAVTQTDSPFKKQTMKSPFSGGGSKFSPTNESPGKPLFMSESAHASDSKPVSLKKAVVSVSVMEKVPLPSEYDALTLLITEVVSPDEFYVHTADSAGKNDELCASLGEYFSKNKLLPLSQPPAQGSLVCAKFSQDGAWYRAEILANSAGSCYVRFVDFGNSETVHLCDMTECPSELVSIPILASCCQLGGVTPPPGSTKWSDEATQLLKKISLVQAEIVNSTSSPPVLKLTTKEGVNIATELINRGLAAASKAAKAVRFATYPQVASLRKVPLPSDSFTVLVSEARNPHELYVQSASCAEQIDELCSSLLKHFTSNKHQPFKQPPDSGSLVCAKFSQDGGWYRAEVIKSSADSSHVRFIDFGNAEVARLCDMSECPSEFVSVPILASCCQLNGVTPPTGSATWSDKATQLLKEATCGIPLQAMIVDSACSPPALKLTTKEGVDIATELINRGLAAAPRAASTVKTKVESTKVTTYPQVASLSSVPLPSDDDSFTVLVTEVSSPAKLYIHTANFTGEVDKLCTSLFTHFTSNKPQPLLQSPSVGSLICGKFSQDGSWYRAEVLENSADSCRVRFIDFGNSETVRLSNMTECPSELVSIPILASCCQLGGVTPPTGSATWSDKATQLLKEATSGVPLQAEIVDSTCSPPTLKLTTKEDVDIATELINRGLAAAPLVTTYSQVASLASVPLPSGNDSFTVLVTEVSSPAKLYIHTANFAGEVDKLCTSLFTHFTSNKPQPRSQPPGVGSLVCGKFSQDGSWYRAEVLESSADSCRVRFIDFGNSETVRLSDMTECPSEFVSNPILACCCQLGGITPPPGSTTWSDKAIQLLKEATSGVPLQAKVIDSNSSPPALKLTNSEDVDLCTVLIGQGLAAASKPSNLSPMAKSTTRVSSDRVCPMVASLQKVSLPPKNKPFYLIVTDVYSPDKLYLQTLEDAGAIDELVELLNKHFSENKPVSFPQSPAMGSLVCAKFSQDGGWYRGEVLETSSASADCCRVLFIDYGNIESVKLSDLAECPPQFISSTYPRLASCCRLSGVAPPTGSTAWSKEATQLLISMASNSLSEGVIVDESVSPPSIKLKNDKITDFAAELVTKGLARCSSASPSSASQHPPQKKPTFALVPEYPKVSGMQRAKLGSNSDYFSVIVSDIQSPEAFFILPIDQHALMEELRNGLNSHFKVQPTSPLSYPPSQGSLVCAKYSNDGAWYRCEVLETYKDSCKLLFIDYGNVETAKLVDMAPCPVKYTSLPILATKCTLSGVTPSAISNKAWSSEAIDLFRELTGGVLNAKVISEGCGEDTVPIELVDTSGTSDVDIASELVSRLLVRSASSTSARAAEVMFTKVPTVDIPTGVPIKVRFVFIVDPSEFFIHSCQKSSAAAFQEMGMTLQSTYNTCESDYHGFVPKVGALCCCQSLLIPDKSWYRCKVISISKKEAKVQSLDFGFIEKIPVSKLLHLDARFVTQPAQAVPCYLSGVQPSSVFGWNSASKAMFKSLLKEKMNAVVGKEDSLLLTNRGKKAISLFTGNGGKSVATALIESGYAVVDPFQSLLSEVSVQHTAPKKIIRDEPTEVPPIPIPRGPIPTIKLFPVIMTHVESLSEFYLQVVTKEKLEELCELLRVIHEYAQTADNFKNLPPLGTVCIAMHSDDSWYRAQVVKVIDNQTCSVLFFDFGNVGDVPLSKMKPVSKEEVILSHPIQSLKCGLYGASAIPSEKLLEVMNLFSTLVPLETVKNCRIVSKYPLLVDLECGSGCPTLSLRDELARNDCLPKPNDLGLTSLLSNKLPADCKPVLVTEIKDPNDFWLQIMDESIANQFEVLIGKIQDYATSSAVLNMAPVLGQLFIAKYSQDDVWYRAKVVQVDNLGTLGDDCKVKVQFVDYGNEEIVDIDQLRPFQHQFKCLPAQAVHCSLVGFKVPAPSLAEKFRSLVENKKLFAVKKDSVPGELCTSVELIDSAGEEDVYIHLELSQN